MIWIILALAWCALLPALYIHVMMRTVSSLEARLGPRSL